MIVKMKFLSITGPKADIDRVVNTYLSKYEIHLENALTELSTMQNITPYIQINPYKETLKQAEDFTAPFWISTLSNSDSERSQKSITTSLRATAMRTAIRYSTAAIPMSSMYGAFTSAREIRSRKWTPYSHPCTSKESTFRTSTAERRRMLTQHFRQKSKRQTMHSASAHGNWQNAFQIPQRIWLQQKSS